MEYDFSRSPEIALVRQRLHSDEIREVAETVAERLSRLDVSRIKPGDNVAVAVGSRGIDRIGQVVAACVAFLKKNGASPIIVPAMGSHGGATAQGQKKILESLGITESSVQAPIEADMAVSLYETLSSDLKIFMAQTALKADWIVPINRVKPHTKFKLPIESGLCKMLTIGLGKADGAREFHRRAVQLGFSIIERGARAIIDGGKVPFGLALLEDGFGRLSRIEALENERLIREEKRLLEMAYGHMAKIPVDNLDILVVDRIGKDISGIGMDSNVTGRHRDITGDFFTAPHVKRIFVRELSLLSDGNANGIGLADVTTSRLVEAMDMEKTRINAITAISPEKAALPIHFDTDRRCLEVCAATAGIGKTRDIRLVRIQNTARLRYLYMSRALEDRIESDDSLERLSPWRTMRFDNCDNLLKFEIPEGNDS